MPHKIEKSSNDLPIPYESLVGMGIKKPILSEELYAKIESAIANFTGRSRWERWGLNTIKKQGSLVLLVGESGTGKTTIARWLAKQIGTGFIPISMGDVGGSSPGDSERNLKKIFAYAEKEGNTTIFFDECDGMLWSRDKAGPDSMWMISVINTLLLRVESYAGLVLMATNHEHFLDSALERRVSDKIIVDKPTYEVRLTLWEEKIPETYPLKPTQEQFKILAKISLTGAEIENAIIAEAKRAIRDTRHPKFESLLQHCKIQQTTNK